MDFSHKTNSMRLRYVFLLLLSSFHLRFSIAIDTLSGNQAIRDSEFLVSNEQNFKLGFFSPGNISHRYVGVMYNIPVMTVTWIANREKPLNDSNGTVEISEDGNLVILDGQKGVVWSSNLSSSVANTSARLLDTGNLVLQDNLDGRTIWESFRHASDSFLPRMRITTELSMSEKNILTSWRSPSNPAVGSFSASIEPLEVPQLVVWNGSDLYWRSGPWNGQIFIGISGMESYVYQNGFAFVNDNIGTAYLTFSYINSSVLSYFLLNSSGILQQKLWLDGMGVWRSIWSSIETECDVYGKCGPFGICNAQGRPKCTCLPGFEPKRIDEWNAANWSNGCRRRTLLRCETNSSVGTQDGFLKVGKVKLPDHTRWFPTLEADCGSQCMNNCSCIAYAYYDGIGCMHWDDSLIDVQRFSSGGADIYIRLATSEFDNKRDWLAIVATTTVLGFITISACTYTLLNWYRGHSEKFVLIDNLNGVKLEELPVFKFEYLANATRDFGSVNKLGEGGFGPVYKGKLPNGQEIAVKRLARSSNQGIEEFKNEVEVISKLQHRNLVRLLGCCVEYEEKMLVYEYMNNGSLDAYIFDPHKQESLDWKKRLTIIEGICRGIMYLHRDSRLKIIHRDLKASNILLDDELNPKISDFGMARIFGGKEDQANTTRVVGTFGYMAPEYALEGRISEKSDVYSFGVLLLEILSGRKNTSFHNDERAPSLIAHAWNLWNGKNITNLMDPLIYNPEMESLMLRYAHVALLCVQERAKDRPNISAILSMLSSEIIDLPVPKQPAFAVNQRSSETESPETRPNKCSVNDVSMTIVVGR